MPLAYSNIYVNNLTPFVVNLDVTFPGNAIESGEWALVSPALQPFDAANHLVAWVSRDVGIHDGESYTTLLNVSYVDGTPIVSANIGLTGTLLGSDITIGAQNAELSDTGHGGDGPYSDTWTDPNGQTWAIEFNYLGINASGYDDVLYNFFMTVPGESA